MSGIKWIQLFFILLLGVDKTHLQDPVVFYRRPGDTVNLRCNDTLPDDPGCMSTPWLYKKKTTQSPDVIVVVSGKPTNANKMSLDSNCSLTVKNITAEDAGRYTCRQFVNSTPRDQHSYLSVLNTTRENSGTEQTLTCSLTLFEYDMTSCATLSWLKDDGTLIKNDVQSICSTTLTINMRNLMKVRCQVTVKGKVQTFIDLPGDFKTTQTTNPPANPPPASNPNKSDVTIAVVFVVLVVVVVMATALVIFFVVKRKNTPTNDIPRTSTNQSTTIATHPGPSANQMTVSADPDDSVIYVSVVHTNQTRAAVGGAKTHDDDDDGDDVDDTVTYSTVKFRS